MVFRYWSTKIVTLLFDSKRNFKNIFTNIKNMTQFEVSICFGTEGKLDSDPTMNEHLSTFKKVFEDMEQCVFKNQLLQFFMHDMNDLFFSQPTQFTRTIFDQMQRIIDMNTEYHENHSAIFDQLTRDVNKCQSIIQSYQHLQEIHDFCLNWTQGRKDRQISLEMGFYKETWLKMDEFTEMIRKVPSGNTKIDTILIETNTLKK